MIKKPRSKFNMVMQQEDPDEGDRIKYIRIFKKDGADFETEVREELGDIEMPWGPIIDTRTTELIKWVYVGSHWWCRRNKGKYEFGRLWAIDESGECVTLWDQRKHNYEPEKAIVYKDDSRGIIVGYTKHEILVLFDGEDLRKPCQFSELRFEYADDYRKFLRMYKK
jgi:hypothetical protein